MAKKSKLKKVLAGVGIVLALATTGGLIAHWATNKKDDDVESATVKYTIGVMTEDGKIDDGKKTSLISDFVEVENLVIDIPDEDSAVSYKVHYYNEDKEYVFSTDMFTVDYEQGELGENIKYARIELTAVEEDVNFNIFNKGFYTIFVNVGHSK